MASGSQSSSTSSCADELTNLPDGASVTFEAALRNERGQPREVDLFVHDNGPGFLPPEAILSVLDPLIHRTGTAQGSGLSLMACYFLVYHHGGKVAIEPKTGTGLSLRITLPSRASRRQPADRKRSLAPRHDERATLGSAPRR